MIKVSDYIAKRLKEHYKVKNFFLVSGGGAMHLNNSLGKEISYIANHHEQACAIAAEGYSRINQELSVVNVTTGPGGLNCLNGVFGQWCDSVPVLYISGQVKYSTTMSSCPSLNLRQLGDQEVDIISVVKPLTKFAKMVDNSLDIKYYLDKAIYEATTGRLGPVWLDIPMNVQAALIEEKDLKEFCFPVSQEKNLDIDGVLEKIKKAKRPLIIAGAGIRLSNSIDIFKQLLEKIKIPVVTTFNGLDILEENHSCYIGRIGTIGQRAGNFALQNADLILSLGSRNNIRQVSYNWENFAKNAFKISVDIDKAELEKPTFKPDLKINVDIKYFLEKLLEKNETIEKKEFLLWCQQRKEKYHFSNVYKDEKNKFLDAYYFSYKLSKNMMDNDILVTANGSACVCMFQVAEVKKNQRIFWNSGNASMGYDLPAAIGAKVASPNRNVICLAGDGSIMMNLQELETIKHNKLPIKIFVLNNAGYASIKQTQRNFFDGNMVASGIDSGVSVPDFCKIAKAFDINCCRLDGENDLDKEIKNILLKSEPFLCEVMIKHNYDFSPKLSAKKLADGTMVSPSLEDMSPFLSKDELEENIIVD